MAEKKRGAKLSDNSRGADRSPPKPRQSSRSAPRGSYERTTSPYKSSQAPKNTASSKTRNAPNSAHTNRTTVTKRSKRRKFRGGNYTLYYVLVGIVLLVVLIVLANTVLFNCTSISVSGNVRYTEQEIADISGIAIGENLLHINTSAAKKNIVSGLIYVDDVQVKKSFPTQITITVTEAEKQYCVTEGGVTAAISQRGKIIEHCDADGLPVVKGYGAETLEPGAWLASKISGKSEIPDKVFKAADKTGLKDITLIDMTDKFNVKVTVGDRVILELGMADEVEQKFAVAVKLLETEIGKDEYVTVNLTNPEVVPVRNTSIPHNNTSSPSVSSSASSSVPENSSEPESSDTAESSEPELPAE